MSNSALPLEVAFVACGVVAREALLLDAQRWDDWLALYAEDARFWLPTSIGCRSRPSASSR